ncbi:hypothetical protein L198_07440 [Cryptococcus wingfieldii CBS 7118]|uniref:N-acetyltransferase domain-containing protein n=1 Tax=Cryptococcus wingfieldii CBS 7118 TaxID=1295528 RepID=A0A1E3ID64_9TREE|nr:hypothetical protein L198_07440 [Cryptococcus wingfieldii CBS 7118]ODN85876.1 hypothetical protein L198_07440 [Cryptococcus wingfieldii CBS 7118]
MDCHTQSLQSNIGQHTEGRESNAGRRYLEGPKERPKTSDRVLNLYEDKEYDGSFDNKPMHLYDINFIHPFQFLETDQVRLEPFVPLKHIEGFLALPDSSWNVMGDLGPYNRQTALEDIEAFRSDPQCLLLAIMDKQRENAGMDAFAGVYGLIEVSEYMDAVFGVINVHPRYQRTHVNTHCMSLVLSYLFDTLRLIRVQYDAVIFNVQSIKSAGRFGFKEEGIARNYNGLVPASKKRKGEEKRQSQDMWLGSMTDYEWETEGRNTLKEMLKRTPVDTTSLE